MEKHKCPVETTLEIINGKWKLMILKIVSQGPVRYGEIGKRLGKVSAKVLTQQLREMEEDGILAREVFPEIPPRVEYSLTEKGVSFFSVVEEMRRWALEEDDVHEAECAFCGDCQPMRKEATA